MQSLCFSSLSTSLLHSIDRFCNREVRVAAVGEGGLLPTGDATRLKPATGRLVHTSLFCSLLLFLINPGQIRKCWRKGQSYHSADKRRHIFPCHWHLSRGLADNPYSQMIGHWSGRPAVCCSTRAVQSLWINTVEYSVCISWLIQKCFCSILKSLILNRLKKTKKH